MSDIEKWKQYWNLAHHSTFDPWINMPIPQDENKTSFVFQIYRECISICYYGYSGKRKNKAINSHSKGAVHSNSEHLVNIKTPTTSASTCRAGRRRASSTALQQSLKVWGANHFVFDIPQHGQVACSSLRTNRDQLLRTEQEEDKSMSEMLSMLILW